MSSLMDPDLRELVAQFVAELPGRAAAIEDAAVNLNMQEVRRLAHQLKGAGGSYGFPEISQAAAQVECAARDVADLTQTIETLRGAVDAAQARTQY